LTTRIESGLPTGRADSKRHHDVAFAIDAARDTAHHGQLELLGAAEIVLRQWE
jgi:hypothetical protein